MAPGEAERCLDRARRAPAADPSVEYPEWYLHRRHFLPDGYLSPRSVRRYERNVRPLYHLWDESRAHREVARLLAAGPGQRLLDLGCATGRALASMARQFPGSELLGLDLSPFMVEWARERSPGAEIMHGDATRLPWAAASIDAVTAIHLLGHVPGKVAATVLGEAARVLRPGGRLILADHRWHDIDIGGWTEVARGTAGRGQVLVRSLALE